MRAMVVTQFGSADVLRLEEMPKPAPEEHDLLIEVHACALNPIDFKVRRGALAKGRQLPIILGFDVSGVVRAMGGAVKDFALGDEVYASPSLVRNGANAEYVCVDARGAARKPAKLDHVQAAALPLVTLTAWEALLIRARIEPNETILIHAGGGGVGHIAIQLAKLRGSRVLTTASRPESLQLSHTLGADLVINYQETDFVEKVREETARKGCPVIFDTVGSDTFDRSLDCLAVDGRLVTCVGSPSTKIAEKLFRINASLYFEFMGVPALFDVRRESQGEILRKAARLVDEGKLRPHVSRVFKLDELRQAHELLESSHAIGKVVLRLKD